LTEHELYTVCQNASAPERTRGLIVRRHHTLPPGSASAVGTPSLSTSPPALSHSSFSQPSSPTPGGTSAFPLTSTGSTLDKRGRKLQWVFGESHAAVAELSRPGGTVPYGVAVSGTSPTSPNYHYHGQGHGLGVVVPRMGIEPASPSTPSADDHDLHPFPPAQAHAWGRPRATSTASTSHPEVLVIQPSPDRAGKVKMNRASTVSVMSGLEAPDWARDFYGAGEHGLDAEGNPTASSSLASAAPGATASAATGAGAGAPLDERAGYTLPGGVYSPPQRTSSRREAPRSRTDEPFSSSAPQRCRIEAAAAAPASAVPRAPDSPPSTWRERHGSLLPDSTRKLRNFFGQRPPSELIASHLTEFFPLGGGGGAGRGGASGGGDGRTERYRLSKQVRASIRKSMGAAAGGALLPSNGGDRIGNRRHSGASVASRASRASSMRTNGGLGEPVPALPKGSTSWEKEPSARPSLEGVAESADMSRFSGSSNGSAADLHITQPSGVNISSVPFPGAPSIKGNRSPRSSSGSMLDPPDEADEEEAGDRTDTGADRPESSAMALNSSTSSSTSTTGDLAETRSLASSLAPSHLDAAGRPQRLSRRMSRLSGSSRLSVGAQSLWERRSKDSDAASIITVDEVTADLETRRASWRASMGAGARDSDEDDDGEGSETAESEFEDDLSDDDDLSDEEVDEDEVEEDEPGTAKPQGASSFLFSLFLALSRTMS